MRRLSRVASVASWLAPMNRVDGRPRGPHSHAGQSTPVISDFIVPGGMLMRSRRIWPSVTASRCSAIASMCQPCT